MAGDPDRGALLDPTPVPTRLAASYLEATVTAQPVERHGTDVAITLRRALMPSIALALWAESLGLKAKLNPSDG